jgi:hypothetical protein
MLVKDNEIRHGRASKGIPCAVSVMTKYYDLDDSRACLVVLIGIIVMLLGDVAPWLIPVP